MCSGGRRSGCEMPDINMPDVLANEYNLVPLPKTWYEEQVDLVISRTIRFANRSDHTGVLVQVDTDEFYLANE